MLTEARKRAQKNYKKSDKGKESIRKYQQEHREEINARSRKYN